MFLKSDVKKFVAKKSIEEMKGEVISSNLTFDTLIYET